jgi:hypothetical protein
MSNTYVHELSFEERGYWPALEQGIDALDETVLDHRDHSQHPHLVCLRFNDLGGGPSFGAQQLPTLITDEQAVQQPIEGDASAVATARQHLKLSHVLQLKDYCTDAGR